MIAITEGIKPDRRRVRPRAALLQAGQSLFATQSVDAVSIDDIVAAADVAKGSFYNHFSDKEALAREIAVTVRAEAEAQVDLANAGVTEPASRMADGSFRGLTVETGLLVAMGIGMVAVTRVLEADGPADPQALSRDLNFGLLRGLGVAEDAARAISAAAVAHIFKET